MIQVSKTQNSNAITGHA